MQVAFSPDGRHLLTCADEKPGVVRSWDLGRGKEVRSLVSPSGSRIWFQLSRDGRQVVTEEQEGVLQLQDGGRGP
jgi:WD40 repeat protein